MSHTLVNWFAALSPWLLLVWVFQLLARRCGLDARGWARLSLLGLLAGGFLALRVEGMALATWAASFNPSFSIPFLGLLAAAVWEQAFSQKVFSAQDWRAGWVFGLGSGLALYPFALGWGKVDPYNWGWHFSALFVAGAMITTLLLWKRNRFGLLLLLSILAYRLQLLPSTNYWDYLIDPVYCLVSIVALSCRLQRWASRRVHSSQRESARTTELSR